MEGDPEHPKNSESAANKRQRSTNHYEVEVTSDFNFQKVSVGTGLCEDVDNHNDEGVHVEETWWLSKVYREVKDVGYSYPLTKVPR